jgi:pimeloyl-ACP methyl ester carboxylesterase
MARRKVAPLSFTANQAAAFRLTRHHLATPRGTPRNASVVDICRDTGGIQAQVMSAAEMSIWTRRRQTTRDEVKAALWVRRDLVKTSAMRFTLHLVPACDFSTYITALQPTMSAKLNGIFARIGAKPADVDTIMAAVLDALGDGPKAQRELVRHAGGVAKGRTRAFLKYAWSAVRPALVDGLICYGPPIGGEVTFTRVDRWLPKQPTVSVEDARAELLRKFLAAFGPATAADFTKWTGIKAGDSRSTLESLGSEAVKVSVDGAPGWMLSRDLSTLAGSVLDRRAPRLLPAFDTFLLAHATKEHLVDPRHYKRVYRNQAWISPVVLLGGRVVGVWFPKTTHKTSTLDVQLFERSSTSIRRAIEAEADALGRFLGVRGEARFA